MLGEVSNTKSWVGSRYHRQGLLGFKKNDLPNSKCNLKPCYNRSHLAVPAFGGFQGDSVYQNYQQIQIICLWESVRGRDSAFVYSASLSSIPLSGFDWQAYSQLMAASPELPTDNANIVALCLRILDFLLSHLWQHTGWAPIWMNERNIFFLSQHYKDLIFNYSSTGSVNPEVAFTSKHTVLILTIWLRMTFTYFTVVWIKAG